MLDVHEEGREVRRIGKPGDLAAGRADQEALRFLRDLIDIEHRIVAEGILDRRAGHPRIARNAVVGLHPQPALRVDADAVGAGEGVARSEEHTSELQSLMRISYAVFCLKKKQTHIKYN